MQDIRVDLYHHSVPDYEVLRRLEVLSRKIDLVLLKEDAIMSIETDALDQAEAAAARNDAADSSAEDLLVKISQMVADLKNTQTDPATAQRITALGAAISDRAARLAASVVANTPAAPTPTP